MRPSWPWKTASTASLEPLGEQGLALPPLGDRPREALVGHVEGAGVAQVLVAGEQVGPALDVDVGAVDLLGGGEVVAYRTPELGLRGPAGLALRPGERVGPAVAAPADQPVGAVAGEGGVDRDQPGEPGRQLGERLRPLVGQHVAVGRVGPVGGALEDVDQAVVAGQQRVEAVDAARQGQRLGELPGEVLVAEGDGDLVDVEPELARQPREAAQPPVDPPEVGPCRSTGRALDRGGDQRRRARRARPPRRWPRRPSEVTPKTSWSTLSSVRCWRAARSPRVAAISTIAASCSLAVACSTKKTSLA